jgi:hypothetical protein
MAKNKKSQEDQKEKEAKEIGCKFLCLLFCFGFRLIFCTAIYCFINCSSCFSSLLCKRSQYLPAAKFFTGTDII